MLKKIVILILLFPTLVFAESEGKKLVKTFWNNVTKKHINKVASTISPHFQGLYESTFCPDLGGFITKKQELQYLQSLNITGFNLSNVRTTNNKKILVVTYDIELLDSTSKTKKYLYPANYHEVYTYFKHNGHWKLISLSFFPYEKPV